jgi:hypothetical protein
VRFPFTHTQRLPRDAITDVRVSQVLAPQVLPWGTWSPGPAETAATHLGVMAEGVRRARFRLAPDVAVAVQAHLEVALRAPAIE